jgi:FkbM family methyltransferase
MIKSILKNYYRIKLAAWAYANLPRRVNIANTNLTIPARNWMVAIPARIETSKICYLGLKRDSAQYWYEPAEYEHFLRIIENKNNFFDVGSNIGWYSYLAAAKGVRQVTAFEFMKEYAEFTASNFVYNKINGKVINHGVGRPQQLENYSDPLADIFGELISLDEFAEENNSWPDVMKMDIEGFELDALKNSHNILLKKPALDISIHPQYLKDRGQSAEEVLDLLANYGYKTIWEGGDTYFMV